jgi:hypothetical protein
MVSVDSFGPLVGGMTFFWLLFSCCVLSAGFFGYGIGYLNGARDVNSANVGDDNRGFSED